MIMTRQEVLEATGPTSGTWVRAKIGATNDGRIVARKITSYQDSGAYLRFSSYGTMKHAGHMPGPYTIPNVWVDARVVFTNRPPSSAMRGFGVMAASFSLELQMDKVAKTIGMDPWQLRLLNAYRNGDMRAHRKVNEDAAMVETIQAAARMAGHDLPAEYQAMTSWDRKAS
jgi:CO/xanthine dehydrogenase Mo-binding subunit